MARTVRAGLPPLGAQGTKYCTGPLWGSLHRRRNKLFNWYLAIKKSSNFVARLQYNKLLFCDRLRRERKFFHIRVQHCSCEVKIVTKSHIFLKLGAPKCPRPKASALCALWMIRHCVILCTRAWYLERWVFRDSQKKHRITLVNNIFIEIFCMRHHLMVDTFDKFGILNSRVLMSCHAVSCSLCLKLA